MANVPSWAAAAAILVIEKNKAWHYEALTQRVLESELSGLGERGGETPAQTLRADMMKNHRDIFEYSFRGYYELRDETAALSYPQVRGAVAILIEPYLQEYNATIRKLISPSWYLDNNDIRALQIRARELEVTFRRVARLESEETPLLVRPTKNPRRTGGCAGVGLSGCWFERVLV